MCKWVVAVQVALAALAGLQYLAAFEVRCDLDAAQIAYERQLARVELCAAEFRRQDAWIARVKSSDDAFEQKACTDAELDADEKWLYVHRIAARRDLVTLWGWGFSPTSGRRP